MGGKKSKELTHNPSDLSSETLPPEKEATVQINTSSNKLQRFQDTTGELENNTYDQLDKSEIGSAIQQDTPIQIIEKSSDNLEPQANMPPPATYQNGASQVDCTQTIYSQSGVGNASKAQSNSSFMEKLTNMFSILVSNRGKTEIHEKCQQINLPPKESTVINETQIPCNSDSKVKKDYYNELKNTNLENIYNPTFYDPINHKPASNTRDLQNVSNLPEKKEESNYLWKDPRGNDCGIPNDIKDNNPEHTFTHLTPGRTMRPYNKRGHRTEFKKLPQNVNINNPKPYKAHSRYVEKQFKAMYPSRVYTRNSPTSNIFSDESDFPNQETRRGDITMRPNFEYEEMNNKENIYGYPAKSFWRNDFSSSEQFPISDYVKPPLTNWNKECNPYSISKSNSPELNEAHSTSPEYNSRYFPSTKPVNAHYRDGTIPWQRDREIQQLNNPYNIHERRFNNDNYYPKYSPQNTFNKPTSPRQYGRRFSSDNPRSSYGSYASYGRPQSNNSESRQPFPDSYDYGGQRIPEYNNTVDIYNSDYQSYHIEPAKHQFTGWAGYKWPTTPKVVPKVSKEEYMPVYTKPSKLRKTYSSDFIKNSMKKYTNRLKLLIFKHFPRGFEVKAGHLDTSRNQEKPISDLHETFPPAKEGKKLAYNPIVDERKS